MFVHHPFTITLNHSHINLSHIYIIRLKYASTHWLSRKSSDASVSIIQTYIDCVWNNKESENGVKGMLLICLVDNKLNRTSIALGHLTNAPNESIISHGTQKFIELLIFDAKHETVINEQHPPTDRLHNVYMRMCVFQNHLTLYALLYLM